MNPMRNAILRWYQSALEAVEPGRVTREALQGIELGSGRVVVLAIGKAAEPMARAAIDVLGNSIHAGLLVTKRGQPVDDVSGFTMIAAGHPVPDQESLRAGELALEMVSRLTPADTVIALLSGGGSALLECPNGDLSLMDIQVTTELLMYSGADIHELNTVRKALSAIKGGGLRNRIGDARCITLLLSDVMGNDPTVIASGPTIPGTSDRARARRVLEQFRVADHVPEPVRVFLNADTPPGDDIDSSRDVRKVIADNAHFVAAAQAAAEADGHHVQRAWDGWTGDARDLADAIIRDCHQAGIHADVLIGGGEATSIVRGDGQGGRNSETALAAAVHRDIKGWTIASLASDGDDGNSGAAGAIVDAATVSSVNAALDALARSDSAGYLGERGALVVTGPSGTNVNDVYIAVRNAVSKEN